MGQDNSTQNQEKKVLRIFLLILIPFILTSCGIWIKTRYHYTYEPVYLEYDDLRNSFETQSPFKIYRAGQIVVYSNWIFVSDPGKGIHLIDNTLPAKPFIKAFLKIPGNHQLAIQNHILYADRFVDLIEIDIGPLLEGNGNAALKGTLKNIFPYPYTGTGYPRLYNCYYPSPDTNRGIVTNWKLVKADEYPIFAWDQIIYEMPANGNKTVSGKNGSTSAFALNDEWLYTIEFNKMKVFSVISRESPVYKTNIQLSNWIETIYPYEDLLFIGSREGMGLYRTKPDPASPSFVSWLSHVHARDPVIYDGSYAYVTLLNGQLLVVDVRDQKNPVLTNTLIMRQRLYGLTLKGNRLYVGTDVGLAIFDTAKKPDIIQISNLQSNIDTEELDHYYSLSSEMPVVYDLIADENRLIASTSSGIYQLDCRNPDKPVIISFIPSMEKVR